MTGKRFKTPSGNIMLVESEMKINKTTLFRVFNETRSSYHNINEQELKNLLKFSKELTIK